MSDDDLLDKLLDLISSVGPDARIPSERELSERWGSSRTALRHRLRMLESMGALERKGSAGTFTRVMRPTDVAVALQTGLNSSSLASPRAFRSVRVALEREAARLAARAARPVPLAETEEAVLRMEASDDADELYHADLEFHRALFRASGDDALIFFSEAVGDLIASSVTERRARMETLSHNKEVLRTLHRNIFEAVRSGDPVAAMAAIDGHFDRIDATQDSPA